MPPSNPKIVVDDLSVRFSGQNQGADVLALDGVNLSVAEGEFVCLVGPSGCGKTTLLRVLAELQPPNGGSARVLRQEANGKRPATAMVFQSAAVFPWMTVLENVAYGLRTQGVHFAQRNRVAREWVHRVKLERFMEAYPHQLSGGMQQRVGLARAFAYNAEVLLLDEPFGALDAQTRLLLQETLLELWGASRSTILFVTHSIDEALTLADRVLVMSARPGRILAEEAVAIPRPRDMVALRGDPRFGESFRRIWSLLRQEVV